MSIAKVTFYKIIQDSQDYGSNDEHMVSRVYFNLEVEDKMYSDLYVDIKQTVGTDFETAPLEVSSTRGYKGPFNHEVFREEVENYYRESFGSQGSAIHIEGGGNIRMRDNTVIREKVVEFEIKSSPTGW